MTGGDGGDGWGCGGVGGWRGARPVDFLLEEKTPP